MVNKRSSKTAIEKQSKKQKTSRPKAVAKSESESEVSELESDSVIGSGSGSEDELDDFQESDSGASNVGDSDSRGIESHSSDEGSHDEDSPSDSNEEDEGDEADGESKNTNGASSSEKAQARKEQKQLRQERKLNRPMGQEIAEIKQVWERLRSKTLPAEVRKNLVDQAMKLCETREKELVFRHDSSRVIQTIFKFANASQRLQLTTALKGSYVDLAKSAYGKYLLVKMLHYGNSKTRDGILSELYGNFRQLMKHKEGAYVIEDTFRDYSTAAQRRQILREFYGGEFAVLRSEENDKKTLKDILAEKPDKRPFIMQNLNQVVTSAVTKGSIGFEIIHAAMLEYVRNLNVEAMERETYVDLVTEQFAEMVHTADGSHVANLTLAIANAKERKKLVKSLKAFGDKLATDQYGNQVLTTIFTTVDDTVYTLKSFMPVFEDHMHHFMTDKYGRRPFLYLLSGRSPKVFSQDIVQRMKEVDEYKKLTSKKDDETRRKDLLKGVLPLIYKTVLNNLETMLSDPLALQFIGELFANDQAEGVEGRSEALEAFINAYKRPLTEKSHPLFVNPMSSRVLKQLVKADPQARELLLPIVLENLEGWATSDGAFVVVALVETEDTSKAVKKALKKTIPAVKASDSKGSQLLLKVL